MLKTNTILENYMQLAAAIVNSGIKQHDTAFLNSEWCSTLISTVVEFNKRFDSHKSVLLTLSHKQAD